MPIDNQQTLDKIQMDVANIEKAIRNKPEEELIEVIAQMNVEDTGASVNNDVTLPDVITDWERLLKSRKFGFYKFLENKGRYDLLDDWKKQETPFIPATFLPKELRYGESEKEYQVRKKRCDNEHSSHMDMLAVRRDEGLAEFESVDSVVKQTIDQFVASPEVKAKLTEEYTTLVAAEEVLSQKRWDRLKKGIEETPVRDKDNKIIVKNDRVYAKALKTGLDTEKEPQRNNHVNDSGWKSVRGRKKKRQSHSQTSSNGTYPPPFAAQNIQFVPYQQGAYSPYFYHQPFFTQQHAQFSFDPSNPPPPITNVQLKKPQNSSFHGGASTSRWKGIQSEERI